MSDAIQKASFDYSDENHNKNNSLMVNIMERTIDPAEQTFSTDKTNTSTRSKNAREHKYRFDKFVSKANHLPSI